MGRDALHVPAGGGVPARPETHHRLCRRRGQRYLCPVCGARRKPYWYSSLQRRNRIPFLLLFCIIRIRIKYYGKDNNIYNIITRRRRNLTIIITHDNYIVIIIGITIVLPLCLHLYLLLCRF